MRPTRGRAGSVKRSGNMDRTPGRAVDIKQTDSGFVVTVDGAHQQACADMAAVIQFVNTILPPPKRARSEPASEQTDAGAVADDEA